MSLAKPLPDLETAAPQSTRLTHASPLTVSEHAFDDSGSNMTWSTEYAIISGVEAVLHQSHDAEAMVTRMVMKLGCKGKIRSKTT